MALGERLRKLRRANGLSQGDLGKIDGIKREYISKMESGDLKNPTINTLFKLADAIRIDPILFLTDNPQALALVPLKEQKYLEDLRKLPSGPRGQALNFVSCLIKLQENNENG